jgi:hypothetical protein
MKDQFQGTENLLVRFPPFIDKLTGDEILTGTCTVTFKRPAGTTGSLSATWDSDIQLWKLDMAAATYNPGGTGAGQWMFKAVSDNPNGRPQRKALQWGDYVDKLDTYISSAAADIKGASNKDLSQVFTEVDTRATQAQILSDATPFAGASVALVKAKTDLIPAIPAAQGDVTSAVTSIKGASNKDNTQLDTQILTRATPTNVTDAVTSIKAGTNTLQSLSSQISTGVSDIRGGSQTLQSIANSVASRATPADVTSARDSVKGAGLKDLATISTEVATRATPADVTSAVTSIKGTRNLSNSDVDDNLADVDDRVALVQAKTNNLPGDPASQAVVDAAVSVVRGLIHDNSYIDQTVYDGDGHMTSARIRHYDSAINATAHGATGLIHTYRLTATFASGTMTSYLMVQE